MGFYRYQWEYDDKDVEKNNLQIKEFMGNLFETF